MTQERFNPNQVTDLHEKEEHLNRYHFAAAHANGRDVLDLACGSGYGSHILSHAGARSVIGVDCDASTVATVRSQYSAANLKFAVDDAEKLQFSDRQFDLVVSFETVEHLKHPEQFVAEVARVLRDDGLFICSTPVAVKNLRDSSSEANQFHLWYWDLAQFKSLLTGHFAEVHLMGQRFNFKKSWLPFNRTLRRQICRLCFPREADKLDQFTVLDFPRIPAALECLPWYQIALCRKPARA